MNKTGRYLNSSTWGKNSPPTWRPTLLSNKTYIDIDEHLNIYEENHNLDVREIRTKLNDRTAILEASLEGAFQHGQCAGHERTKICQTTKLPLKDTTGKSYFKVWKASTKEGYLLAQEENSKKSDKHTKQEWGTTNFESSWLAVASWFMKRNSTWMFRNCCTKFGLSEWDWMTSKPRMTHK